MGCMQHDTFSGLVSGGVTDNMVFRLMICCLAPEGHESTL